MTFDSTWDRLSNYKHVILSLTHFIHIHTCFLYLPRLCASLFAMVSFSISFLQNLTDWSKTHSFSKLRRKTKILLISCHDPPLPFLAFSFLAFSCFSFRFPLPTFCILFQVPLSTVTIGQLFIIRPLAIQFKAKSRLYFGSFTLYSGHFMTLSKPHSTLNWQQIPIGRPENKHKFRQSGAVVVTDIWKWKWHSVIDTLVVVDGLTDMQWQKGILTFVDEHC